MPTPAAPAVRTSAERPWGRDLSPPRRSVRPKAAGPHWTEEERKRAAVRAERRKRALPAARFERGVPVAFGLLPGEIGAWGEGGGSLLEAADRAAAGIPTVFASWKRVGARLRRDLGDDPPDQLRLFPRADRIRTYARPDDPVGVPAPEGAEGSGEGFWEALDRGEPPHLLFVEGIGAWGAQRSGLGVNRVASALRRWARRAGAVVVIVSGPPCDEWPPCGGTAP